MNYRELWNDENTQIRERYDLAMERIAQIPSEERIAEPFRDYFAVLAHFAGQIEELQDFSFARSSKDIPLRS